MDEKGFEWEMAVVVGGLVLAGLGAVILMLAVGGGLEDLSSAGRHISRSGTVEYDRRRLMVGGVSAVIQLAWAAGLRRGRRGPELMSDL